MKVRYSPRATGDLHYIYDYLVQRSPRGAVNVMVAILAAIEFMKRHPEAAPAVTAMAGVRGMLVRRYPVMPRDFAVARKRDGSSAGYAASRPASQPSMARLRVRPQ
jgi:plasmid stabilization system protein ParE